MNKIKFGLLLILSGIFIDGFSQLNDFDLSKYKLPDLERRALETYFNIFGANQFYELQNNAMSGDGELGTNRYSGDIILNYNHYLNTSDYQRETNLGLDLSSDFLNRKEDKELLDKYTDIGSLLYLKRNNRKYYNDLLFLETNLDLYYKYENDKRSSWNIYDDSERWSNLQNHAVSAKVPIKFGSGRIEQVQDARHAIYIFDELSKIDRVTQSKSDEEISEFAEFISKLKNKRFFDSRLRRMAEIESVDSLLTANNYVSEQDARYYTTLNDFWAYGNRPYRSSGTRLSASVIPGYYYYDFNNTGDEFYTVDEKYSLSAFLFNGGIEFKHEKPLNLFWQHSIDAIFYTGIIEGKVNDKINSIDNKLRIPNIQLGLYHTLGYYPNTRTDISFGYSVQYVRMFDKSDLQNEILGAEAKAVKAATNLLINYYISPRFRLNFESSLYYIWQESEEGVMINFDNVIGSNKLLSNYSSYPNGYTDYFMNKIFQNSFRISLIYSLF